MIGYLHSLETMGLVDGPGVRGVVFLAGCPLRCLYCHNPDTWQYRPGTEITPDALAQRLLRFRGYYERSGGGVTFSGGEPLCQKEFVAQTMALLQAQGIHTCLDTSGGVNGDMGAVLRHTDLILYDVKHYDPERYRFLTGQTMDATLNFLRQAEEARVPIWARHVVVPGLTDTQEHMQALRRYVSQLPNIRRVELLPYHKMGDFKYTAQGRPNPLADVPPMDKRQCLALERQYFGTFTKESA